MKVVYAESSAVLAWLLGEPRHGQVTRVLGRADQVVTSTLTIVECRLALWRAVRSGRIDAADQRAARLALDDALPGSFGLKLCPRSSPDAPGNAINCP